MEQTATLPAPQTRRKPDVKQPRLWNVVLLDDSDHSYEYVMDMVQRLFGHPIERAFLLAKKVDEDGRAVCMTTHRELAELKAEQIHGFGADVLVAGCKGSMSAHIEPADFGREFYTGGLAGTGHARTPTPRGGDHRVTSRTCFPRPASTRRGNTNPRLSKDRPISTRPFTKTTGFRSGTAVLLQPAGGRQRLVPLWPIRERSSRRVEALLRNMPSMRLVIMAVPFIMLSNTASMPLAASPS